MHSHVKIKPDLRIGTLIHFEGRRRCRPEESECFAEEEDSDDKNACNAHKASDRSRIC